MTEKKAIAKLQEALSDKEFVYTPRMHIDQERLIDRVRPELDIDKRETTMVYVMATQDGRHAKIGYSKDLEQRRRDLQPGSALPLEVLLVIPHSTLRLAKLHEGWLLERFADLRLTGEWFEYRDELVEWVKKKQQEQRDGL